MFLCLRCKSDHRPPQLPTCSSRLARPGAHHVPRPRLGQASLRFVFFHNLSVCERFLFLDTLFILSPPCWRYQGILPVCPDKDLPRFSLLKLDAQLCLCIPGYRDLPLQGSFPHCRVPTSDPRQTMSFSTGPCLFPFTTVTLCRKLRIGEKGLLAICWIILNDGNILQVPGKKRKEFSRFSKGKTEHSHRN